MYIDQISLASESEIKQIQISWPKIKHMILAEALLGFEKICPAIFFL